MASSSRTCRHTRRTLDGAVLMAGREVDPGPALEVDEDADWNETEDLDDGTEPLPPACDGGMSGWCGQLRKHSRCYFNHPDGITTVKAGMYGMWDGHQWVCTCPCHEIHAFPGPVRCLSRQRRRSHECSDRSPRR